MDLLISLLRISPREAKARVERAQDVGPRRAITGEPLGPVFPANVVEVAEELLVEAARHENPTQLTRTAALLLARLDRTGSNQMTRTRNASPDSASPSNRTAQPFHAAGGRPNSSPHGTRSSTPSPHRYRATTTLTGALRRSDGTTR
jgi:hypothetical protein